LNRKRVASLLGLALTLAACATQTGPSTTGDDAPPGVLPGEVVTEQGQLAASLYLPVFVIAVAVFVLIEGLLLFMAFRFRRRATDTELPTQTHGHNLLEVAWTLIPALIVTGLFVASMSVLLQNEPDGEAPAVTVDVIGFQWQWTFEYPDYTDASGEPVSLTGAGIDGPEMVLPVGETVRFRLHAQDVIHSFYVPQFFHKLDVIPGRVNQFEQVILQPGTYGGQCAEFCGLAHADMYFTVRAVERAEFDTWIAEAQAAADITPPPRPSGSVTPGEGTTLALSSISIADGFDPEALEAPADTPITFELNNPDTAAPHNVAIRGGNPDGSDWIGEPFADPSSSAIYEAPALAADTYEFYCSIHPNMVGTLNVGN
jgi:cytochrome c oxidase subunit 2